MQLDPSGTIGLIFVHGIGEPSADALRQKFLNGLRRAIPEVKIARVGDVTTAIYRERTVRLYDFSWTGLCSGDPDPDHWRLNWPAMAALPWLPSFNLRCGLYREGDYSRSYVLAWTVLLMPIALAFFTFYLALKFGDKLYDAVTGDRLRAYREEVRKATRPDGSIEKRPWFHVMHQIWASYPLPSERFVNDYIHVVLNYVYSAEQELSKDDRFHDAAEKIWVSFRGTLKRACDDGCSELQVMAHSLGSVIAYQGLLGEYEPSLAKVTTLYTIGSPLEKIRFFWPALIALTERSRQRQQDGRNEKLLVWHNFYDPFDLIAGKLQRFDANAAVKNHRVRGAAGLLSAHIVYERSWQFLTIMTHGLFGATHAPRRGMVKRIGEASLAGLESIIALPLFVIAAAAGVTEILMAGLLLPFSVGALLDDWGFTQSGGRVGSLVAFVLVLIVAVWMLKFGRTMAWLLAHASHQRHIRRAHQ